MGETTTICIFIPTGRTFTFKNAAIITDNETVLVLSYTAMSDGLLKTVTFQKSQIAGWALTSLGVREVLPRPRKASERRAERGTRERSKGGKVK